MNDFEILFPNLEKTDYEVVGKVIKITNYLFYFVVVVEFFEYVLICFFSFFLSFKDCNDNIHHHCWRPINKSSHRHDDQHIRGCERA